MSTAGRIRSYFTRGVSSVSGPFHPFGGAVDIIIVEQPDCSLKSSPWYVRFGKFQGVLKAKEKIVNISVNGVEASFCMYLDQSGEAYFLREAGNGGEELEPSNSSSSSGDEMDQMVAQRLPKSNSNFQSKGPDSAECCTKIVAQTNSHRSRILELVFGRKTMKADSFVDEDGDPMMDRMDSLERAVIVADLLEMRWSTNIPAKNYRKDGVSKFSALLDSENKVNEVVVSINDEDPSPKSPGALSQQSSKDQQFQLSNFDGYKESKAAIAMKASPGQTEANDEESLTEAEKSKDKPENVSGAINIITVQTADREEGTRLAKSLPNLRSGYCSFEYCGPDHPLARSLDLDNKYLGLSMHSKDDTISVKSDGDMEEKLDVEQVGICYDLRLADAKIASVDPSAEISMCRHLLYEGMGSEAASRIFDANKLDVDIFSSLSPTIVNDDRLVVRLRGHYFPWDVASPITLGMVSFGSDKMCEPTGMIAVDRNEGTSESTPSNAIAPSGGSWSWPFSFKRSRSRKVMHDRPLLKPKTKKMVRVMTPSSDQLASLNLKEGCNSVTFTFCTAMLGKQQVDAQIYLWKWNTHVIISDVDGTITKSDVLGQFMPLVGMDWSQTGVAHLFSAIKAYLTRQFLFKLKQDGKSLPDGPVVISPDGLFPSLYREVIRRAPHEFKIATLQDIRDLFPADHNPFYAGFGNRNTDEISYLKVGIPKGKIFTINPKGEIAVNKHINTKSYATIHALVNGMFPPISSFEQEDFNSWNYWKLPLPDIDI